MELGLSLGDAPKPLKLIEKSSEQQQLLQKKTSVENGGPNLCVALGLKTYSADNEGPEKNQNESAESGGEEDDPNSWEEGNTNFMNKNNSDEKTLVQLNLLPQVPVPRRLSLPWVSDNAGSSENGSSGNMGLPAPMGPAVNRPAEEVSSANSVGSAFRLDFSVGKRDFDAGQNDDVAAMSDDESGPHSRKKLRLSKQQSAFLEETFKDHNTLNPKQKLALAKQLNLRPRQVEVWFQNRRARTKLKQTEVDCDYLKRCCETLSDENRRLQKELQELRALKISTPFCMQSPATTLTMCPSCERVASSAGPPPSAVAGKMESTPKSVPFAVNRPKFFPFSQNPVRHPHNRPAAS